MKKVYQIIRAKFRFFYEMRTMYSHIVRKLIGIVKSELKFKPLYPHETNYAYDQGTERVLAQLKSEIPDKLRGDNPAFCNRWKNVFEKEQNAKEIAGKIKKIVGTVPFKEGHLLESVREQGFVHIQEKQLSEQVVADILSYLSKQKAYSSHIAHFASSKAAPVDKIKKDGHSFGSYDLQTIVRTPHIAKLLTDETVVGLISEYFGCLPVLSNVNLFWSFKQDNQRPSGPQHFHRDIDDYKTCTLYINLTDTAADDGAHCYIAKTHSLEKLAEVFVDKKNDDLDLDLNPFGHRIQAEDIFNLPLMGYGLDKLFAHFFKEQFANLCGPKGMMFVTDNFGLHRGVLPKTKDRLILWVSYALTSTHSQAAAVKHQKRIHFSELKGVVADNPVNRYILRNTINFSETPTHA